MTKTFDIASSLAQAVKATHNPKYDNTPFSQLPHLHSRTKGKLFETMVAEVLTNEGHEVFDSTNQQHDMKVRFKGEMHKTKIEIKGALERIADDKFYTGSIVMSDDFDEVFILFVHPTKIQGWRINRSILRGMEADSILKPGKGAYLFADIDESTMIKYDCTQVF